MICVNINCMKVKIERLGTNGEGIFYIPEGENKGKISFVDFALPNEIVDCDITKEHSKYSIAKLNNVLQKSCDRVNPKCKYFGICGGCDLQHMSNNLEEKFKKQKILDVVNKIDDCICDVEIVSCNQINYRNKMVFPFEIIDGKLILGMFKKSSHNVIDICNCLLASDNINKVLQVSKEFFLKKSEKYLDKKLRYLVIREINNQILVGIVCNQKIQLKDYYEVLKNHFENVGLSIIVGNCDNEILAGKYFPLYGKNEIDINEFGINYSIDIMSFSQINNEVKKCLYLKILSSIDDENFVIDAFSGAGLLTAIVSSKCKSVVGIEINKFASNMASKILSKNNISNVNNICGDANKLVPIYCSKYKNATLILDPARSGCGKEINSFLSKNSNYLPKKIIYVSCNLATLQRDLQFYKSNYELKSVYGFNMFPFTKHIETLVCLQRREDNN